MISTPILKSFISYLSNVNGISAIYDENFVLQWSNDDEFFKELDISEVKRRQPLQEAHFKTQYQGETADLTVTPIYRSKRVVDSYTFTVKNFYHSFQMLECSAVSDYMLMAFDSYKQQTDNLLELNRELMEDIQDDREVDILNTQSRMLSAINNEMKTYSKAVFAKHEPLNVNCNVSLLMSVICKDASNCLNDIKRSLNVKMDERNCYIKINAELFVIAVAYILKCHLMMSPLKSAITVDSRCEKDKSFHVVIKSKSKKEEMDKNGIKYATFSRNFAEKLIRSDCNGIFKCNDDGKTTVTEFELPVFLKNRGSMLTSRNSVYLDPEYKPVRSMLKIIMESEIEQIEEMKMKNATKRKLEKF